MIAGLHNEDIKASIRKKYGTLNAFERAHGLPHNSVSAWMRGNPSRPVRSAVEAHLRSIISPLPGNDKLIPSKPKRRAHRLNETAA